MPNDNENDGDKTIINSDSVTKEQFAKLDSKVDELIKTIASLIPKTDTKLPPKKPEDVIEAENAFRVLLADNLPKEKLDAMSLKELTLVFNLKGSMKKEEIGNNLPAGKSDSKEDKTPKWMSPEVN